MLRRKEDASHGATVITISTGTIFRTICIVLAVAFLYIIRDIVILFLVALLIAALIDPFAERMKRVGLPRGLSVFFLYVIGLAVIAGVFILVVPPMAYELSQLANVFAPLLSDTSFGDLRDIIQNGTWAQGVESIASTVQQAGVLEAIPQLGSVLQGAFGGVLAVFVVLVLAFYMVVEENVIRRGIALFASPEYQPFVTQLSVKMREKIGAWLRGQLLVMFSIGLLCYIVLIAFGIPYALVLALFAAVLEVVPFLGPMLSVVPAAIIAFSVSPLHAVFILIAYFVIQQFEGHVLVPKIMQKTTGLNPIVSIIAILIGFQVDGILGAVLSVPVAMVISVFYNEVFRQRENVDAL